MQRALAFFFSAITLTSAGAQEPVVEDPGAKKPAAAKSAVSEPGLDGFQFTAGLGVIHTGKNESIVATTVDNGILRVTERQKVQNGLWLASHMFTDSCITMDEQNKVCTVPKKSRFGAFVAAQIGGGSAGGESRIVQAIALGVSYTYMSRLSNTSGSAPLVFSVGVASVPVRKLAESYEDNKSLPQGSNQPVIVTKNVFAPLVMVSYRFGGL